jgi:hypothetical protein
MENMAVEPVEGITAGFQGIKTTSWLEGERKGWK